MDSTPARPLLESDEPPAVGLENPQGAAHLLLLCDHASNTVPRALANLGLDEEVLGGHMGWDIGALEVMRFLAARFDAPGIYGGYSRLVMDLNRESGDPASILAENDGIAIPGNRHMDEAALRLRAQTLFHPYHDAIAAHLAAFAKDGIVPVVIGVHSFAPQLARQARHWNIGVLWNRDPRIAMPLIDDLSARPGLVVGDNMPYTGRMLNYTVDIHAQAAGLPHVAIEIRNDLIDTPQGVEHWAEILCAALAPILDDPELYRIGEFR